MRINTQELYEAISYTPLKRLKPLAERCLQDAEARIENPPEPVLLMARVRETVDGEVFNLGEVLVTTCEVTLDDEPGWAMVTGHDPERALCAALVDAASRGRDAKELRKDLAREHTAASEARRERWAAVQPTRVEFEEMT